MELEHSFTVPAGVQEAWATLLDVERIAPCMPGATLTDFDGEVVSGTVKVKVGPIVINYNGQALFRERDEATHTVVLEASGKESRAAGTASATVQASLQPEGVNSTKVLVRTDLTVTGRPAKFGRGVISDVAAKLIGQFADSLAAEMATSNNSGKADSSGTSETANNTGNADNSANAVGDVASTGVDADAAPLVPTSAGVTAPTVPQRAPRTRSQPEAINLVGAVAIPMLKRTGLAICHLFARLVFWRRGDSRRGRG
jgi:uncharacterized protein